MPRTAVANLRSVVPPQSLAGFANRRLHSVSLRLEKTPFKSGSDACERSLTLPLSDTTRDQKQNWAAGEGPASSLLPLHG